MSTETEPDSQQPALPCHVSDPDLWFADSPIRRACLSAALERAEPWGVWGGEILERGSIVSRKRPRGRPRRLAA
jgi:WhiB family redox-sensing transcriptional regulator